MGHPYIYQKRSGVAYMIKKLKKEIKIMSLEGSDILKNNEQGKMIDKKYNIVFNKSLLLNKLYDIGLATRHDKTRDIINVKFTHGHDDNPEKIKQLQSLVDDLRADNKDSIAADINYNTKEKANRRIARKENSNLIQEYKKEIAKLKLSKEAVRDRIYQDGFYLDFYKVAKDSEAKTIIRDENGKKVYVLDERIHYKYFFRTSSKANQGEVFFINAKLSDEISKWQQIGISFAKDEECKLVEMEAYKSLTASNIEGLIHIDPHKQILVINDLDSFSTHKCKLVKTDEDGNCYVENDDNYKLKNTLFDGQSLIDSSLMQTNPMTKNKGGVLLRNHMFKSFALNTNIEQFMRDTYKEDYDTAYIKDKYCRDIKVSDIKLITTENSMKWEKFDIDMIDWCDAVKADNNLFGIVKTEKVSKYIDLQRMSYQMLNTLDPEKIDIDCILHDTLTYTHNIQNDIDSYINYLDTTKSEMNSNEMLIDLYNNNPKIMGTELFRDYKKFKIREWKDRLKSGKILINGDNLIIIGSPYVMLQHAIGRVPNQGNVMDGSYVDASLGQGGTCYTTRFNDGEQLASFRSPHNSPNNIGYLVNTKSKLMDKYFNCTPNIICVNLIGANFQDRHNGSDQDSDAILTTNQVDIVNFARESQESYPTIVNCISEDTRRYSNNSKSMAMIDNALAKGKADIGVASNLAQEALSWYMDSKDPRLADVVAITSVFAQVAIDSAKRQFGIDLKKQINLIRKLECMQVKVNDIDAKPSFWQYTSKSFSAKEDSKKLLKVNCMMCLLEDEINKIKDSKRIDNINLVDLLYDNISNKYKYEQIQSVIDKYKAYQKNNKYIINKIKNTSSKKHKSMHRDQQKELMMKFNVEMAKIKINNKNMKALIKKSVDKKNGLDIDFIKMLYSNNRDVFLSVFAYAKGVNEDKDPLVS